MFLPYDLRPPADAIAQARSLMIEAVVRRNLIYYSDVAAGITALRLTPRHKWLFHILAIISSEEDAAGHGMLTAVVVRKNDRHPGKGFFDLASLLGHDISDPERFWIRELRRVYNFWATERRRNSK